MNNRFSNIATGTLSAGLALTVALELGACAEAPRPGDKDCPYFLKQVGIVTLNTEQIRTVVDGRLPADLDTLKTPTVRAATVLRFIMDTSPPDIDKPITDKALVASGMAIRSELGMLNQDPHVPPVTAAFVQDVRYTEFTFPGQAPLVTNGRGMALQANTVSNCTDSQYPDRIEPTPFKPGE